MVANFCDVFDSKSGNGTHVHYNKKTNNMCHMAIKKRQALIYMSAYYGFIWLYG